MNSLLSLVTFLPTIGAVVLLVFLRGEDALAQKNAKLLALFTTGATFLLSLFVLFGFDAGDPGFQFVEEQQWIGGLTYKMGVDGISVLFLMLTTFLMPITIWSTWGVTDRVKEYMVAFLVLETLMLGVFCALDLVLFYIFFEGQLIPMFLIIGIWGGRDRIYAAFKFFLYTFFGSVLMLVAMIAMYYQAGTTDIPTLLDYSFASDTMRVMGFTIAGGVQTLMWLAFFASFAVKMPMWPVHTWLPDAHVQAPTAGSVILAAILLKMGGYGFLRFSVPMFPVASELMADFVFTLSVIAIIYTSLVAMMQEDMKKLVAYSSVAHMGFVTMGIFALNRQGIDGAIFQMLSHGFISGALFLIVGVIYDRMHTREIAAYGGLVNRMPAYALVFMLFTLGNVGLPGTSGFVGEFLTLAGAFQVSTWVAFFAATGVILSACYALWLYRKVVFGDLIKESLKTIKDMSRREKLIFVPLVAAMLVLGVYPALVLDTIGPSVAALIDHTEAALAAAEAAAAVAAN
jgi:NADH-quinone oxidoreductase subunit M